MPLSPLDLLQFTWRSLGRNPLRSALTTLGVFMGVAAVGATLQVGSISREVMQRELARRDAPSILINPRWSPRDRRFIFMRLEDMEFLRQRLPAVRAISAFRNLGAGTLVFQEQQAEPNSLAVTQDFLESSGQQLLQGRFFVEGDFSKFRPVMVIDRYLAEQLFERQNPVGQRLFLNSQPYTVVGVVSDGYSDDPVPQGRVLTTLAYYQGRTGDRTINRIRVRPYTLAELEPLGQQMETLMKQRYPNTQFRTVNNVEEILAQQAIWDLASRALAVVGAISLLVGGVGIANIMIASVAERTAEIGLQRALGATQSEIMLQFILEATILSVTGGAIALITVHGLTVAVSRTFNLPYTFEVRTGAIALGSAVVVGVGSSLLPAFRASRLDPVKALRSE